MQDCTKLFQVHFRLLGKIAECEFSTVLCLLLLNKILVYYLVCIQIFWLYRTTKESDYLSSYRRYLQKSVFTTLNAGFRLYYSGIVRKFFIIRILYAWFSFFVNVVFYVKAHQKYKHIQVIVLNGIICSDNKNMLLVEFSLNIQI